MPHDFYQIGTDYKLIPHTDTWNCIEFTKTHAVLVSLGSGMKYQIPHNKQHLWMYKKIKLDS